MSLFSTVLALLGLISRVQHNRTTKSVICCWITLDSILFSCNPTGMFCACVCVCMCMGMRLQLCMFTVYVCLHVYVCIYVLYMTKCV